MDEPSAVESTGQPEDPTFLVDVATAIQKLGETMVLIAREQELSRQMLTQIMKERKEILDLVTAQDARIKALAALQTSDHTAIEVLMASQGNGMGPRHVC